MMTDKEYYTGLFTHHHGKDCDWHTDQYWWECSCGAVTAELREEWRRRERHQRKTND